MHPSGAGEHVLDVETLRLSHELPRGWSEMHHLGISCCVVHDIATERDLVFAAERVDGAGAIEALHGFLEACRSKGCTLVGHNLRAFDWRVLADDFEARGLVPDRHTWDAGAAKLVDTLASLHARLGWRPSLQLLAWHNLGETKSLDGRLAPELWRQGSKREVIAYCRRDVDLTRRVWLKGRHEGRVAVGKGLDGAPVYVPVDW